MADLKISQLTASTTPLAGTEVLPIVQSSTTKQVSVANLTAGRNVAAANLDIQGTGYVQRYIKIEANTADPNYNTTIQDRINNGTVIQKVEAGFTSTTLILQNGNLTLSSAGNFVVGVSGKGIDFSATSGAGTSEVLNDYEEGTWTPTVGGTWTVTPSIYGTATYTKIGRSVTVNFAFLTGTKATTFGGYFDGLPYNVGSTATGAVVDNNIVNRGLAEVTSTARVWVTDLSFPDVNFVTVTYFV